MTLSFSTHINDQPNFFVEKIWASLDIPYRLTQKVGYWEEYLEKVNKSWVGRWDNFEGYFEPKFHTIREDKYDRWQPGIKIHPVINNRTENRFQFAPTIPCRSTQKIIIEPLIDRFRHYRPRRIFIDNKLIDSACMVSLAINDGFESVDHMFDFFKRDYTGKIIHWTNLRY